MSKTYYLGREIKEEVPFKEKGTFQSYWTAQGWLRKSGYVYGSSCINSPIAIRKGVDFDSYNLPQKWKNFTQEEIDSVDGVIVSRDFREGEVKVIIF
jgi:hypothetical protein